MRAFTVSVDEMDGERTTLTEQGSILYGLLHLLILLLVHILAGEELDLLQ